MDVDHGGSSASKSPRSKSTTSKSPKAKPESQPVAGAHELKVAYVEAFEATRGTTPEFGKRWSRAMKAFGELVQTHGLDSAKAICSAALKNQYCQRINPWELAEDANKHLGKRMAPAQSRHAVQTGLHESCQPSTPYWLVVAS